MNCSKKKIGMAEHAILDPFLDSSTRYQTPQYIANRLKKHTIQLFENLAVYTNSRLMFWKVRQVLLQISSAVKLS